MSENETRTYLVDTGYAAGGVTVNPAGVVVEAAPIFKWMLGKPWESVKVWPKIQSIQETASRVEDEPEIGSPEYIAAREAEGQRRMF